MVVVVVMMMIPQAFMLEPCAAYAVHDGTAGCLVLGFCSTTHNPRISKVAAHTIEHLAAAGWLRILTPERDMKNAADFVLSFWVGWLHLWLPEGASFSLVSEDIHLERTVVDLLVSLGRTAVSNPDHLQPVAKRVWLGLDSID